MAVTMPIGAMARMMSSAKPMDWLMNCIVTRSPKRANNLVRYFISSATLAGVSQYSRRQIREEIVGEVISFVSGQAAADERSKKQPADDD
jgi:hypothetical protein